MNTFRKISIRKKLVLIILTASIISIISGLAIYLVFDMISIRNEMKKNAELNATLVGQYSIVPLVFDYKDEATDVLAKLSSMPAVVDALIFNTNGDVFASYYKNPVDTFVLPDHNVRNPGFSKGYLNVYHDISYDGKDYGTLYLRLTDSAIREKFMNNILVMMALILLLFVPVYFIANRLQKLISEPILNLARLTATISQNQDFTVQLKPQGNDEVGILYQQFNNFLSQILKRQKDRDEAEKEIVLLAQVVKNINEFVSITDLEDNVIFVNHAWLKTFGYSENEVYGKKNKNDCFIK